MSAQITKQDVVQWFVDNAKPKPANDPDLTQVLVALNATLERLTERLK